MGQVESRLSDGKRIGERVLIQARLNRYVSRSGPRCQRDVEDARDGMLINYQNVKHRHSETADDDLLKQRAGIEARACDRNIDLCVLGPAIRRHAGHLEFLHIDGVSLSLIGTKGAVHYQATVAEARVSSDVELKVKLSIGARDFLVDGDVGEACAERRYLVQVVAGEGCVDCGRRREAAAHVQRQAGSVEGGRQGDDVCATASAGKLFKLE